jgi:predicted Zn finger-like uncharacterized protein
LLVTCPSCEAQYNLDPARLGGRDAKARCRRCGRMMAIVAPPDVERTDPRSATPAPTMSRPATQVPAAVRQAPAVSAAQAPAAVRQAPAVSAAQAPAARPGPAIASARPAAAPAQVAAPRGPVAVAPPQAAAPRVAARVPVSPPAAAAPRAPEPPRAAAPLSADDAARLAPTLDFKRLGVLSWRARTTAGRLLDFADLRTLRAYLRDGRLGPADSISVDGRSWLPIEAIPDLDVFFVATWEELHVARTGTPPPWADPATRARLLAAAPPRPAPAPVSAPAPRAEAPAFHAPVYTPEPPPRRFPYGAVSAALLVVFGVGFGSGAVWMSARAEPAPVASLPAVAPAPARVAGPEVPTFIVGGTHTASTTPTVGHSSVGLQAAAGATPRRPLSGKPTDAIAAASQITPSVAPGEGAPIEGTENIGKPSDLVMVEEIPPSQVEAALRREGLK